ncbi:Response regulator receiver protein CpdR [Methanosarcinaceae archaeon Ag5]|uniref:Response regulator receiver protein CpdR n=2 Tax=Methanolapillus africanus TaxID=3028297 RepID=A0AAE4SDH3_9EURY|nr:Response regulator receiver protein CpdR [Methanosarcinaceae archaeon Ag5]
MNRELVKDILETFNCVVTGVEDAFAALELLEKNAYDLVLIDINLPKMNGVELAQRILDSDFKYGKMVALTANECTPDGRQFQDAGFDDFIQKPFQINDFRKKIEDNIPEHCAGH